MIISKFPPPSVGQKADGFIKLSDETIELPATIGETATFTFFKLGNGVVTVNSSDIDVCTASLNGNTVILTVTGSGYSDITVSVAESSTNKATSAVCSCAKVSPVLSENTPAMIKIAAGSGITSSIWNVGDMTAPIIISSSADLPNFTPPSEGVCAFIIGFDHNSELEGTGIHFQFGKTTTGVDIALCDSGYNSAKSSGTWFNMNNSQSNSGGWNSSRMRTVICPAFLSALPQEWQNVISETTKYSDNTGGGSDTASYVTSASDKIWLLAEYEVQGSRTYANSAEQNYQEQYDYYKNGNSKKKYRSTATSTGCNWWLRSARVNSTYRNYFCSVDISYGDADNENAYYSGGFAPGFKVGGDSV